MCAPMTDEHDAEADQLVAELERAGLERAGLITVGTDAEGHETSTLSPRAPR